MALAFEVVLIGWMLLWPILTPGSPPSEVVILPNLPYRGSTAERPQSAPHLASAQRIQFTNNPIFERPRKSARIEMADAAPPTDLAPPASGDNPLGVPNGLQESIGNSGWTIAPPVPAPSRRIRQSEGIQAGLLIHRVDPPYPQLARIAHISGTVELRAIIGRDGSVRSVEVLSGSPLLVRAAVDAVRQWRYRPTLLDGEAVEVETRITVRFVLGQ
ncbi:MAG TPA: energy transducer TonB [Candidatus Acidoferrales bacterium]|nr:energy transducer TonB [Candidatus Acidoferrales bacterium]